MFLQVADPLKSRNQYKVKSVQIIVTLAVMCILGGALLFWLGHTVSIGWTGALLIDAFCLLATFYVFLLWDNRPIRVRCACGQIVLSNTPWACGHCGHKNRNANEHSFLGACESCHDEPKAYKCHHCNQLMFLSEDKNLRNYASCINSPSAMTQAEKLQKKKEKKEKQKTDIEHEIYMKEKSKIVAELDADLAKIMDDAKVKGKSPAVRARKALKGFIDFRTAVQQAADQRTAYITQKFKNDRTRLRREKQILKEWVEDQLRKGNL
jgi:hypothetical protein